MSTIIIIGGTGKKLLNYVSQKGKGLIKSVTAWLNSSWAVFCSFILSNEAALTFIQKNVSTFLPWLDVKSAAYVSGALALASIVARSRSIKVEPYEPKAK